MKLKLKELNAIRRLITQDTPGEMSNEKAYSISCLASEVIQQDKIIDDFQKKIINKHTDKKGNINMEAINEDMNEILDKEIELPDIEPLMFDEIKGLKFTSVQRAELMRLGLLLPLKSKKENAANNT